mmetsp:Transcript_114910/g.371476  ORF Transcript_114910/g.371476 Transcript_114910/m.371476 type:complete len:270 (-) Transcript_114910:561-1370(-)
MYVHWPGRSVVLQLGAWAPHVCLGPQHRLDGPRGSTAGPCRHLGELDLHELRRGVLEPSVRHAMHYFRHYEQQSCGRLELQWRHMVAVVLSLHGLGLLQLLPLDRRLDSERRVLEDLERTPRACAGCGFVRRPVRGVPPTRFSGRHRRGSQPPFWWLPREAALVVLWPSASGETHPFALGCKAAQHGACDRGERDRCRVLQESSQSGEGHRLPRGGDGPSGSAPSLLQGGGYPCVRVRLRDVGQHGARGFVVWLSRDCSARRRLHLTGA